MGDERTSPTERTKPADPLAERLSVLPMPRAKLTLEALGAARTSPTDFTSPSALPAAALSVRRYCRAASRLASPPEAARSSAANPFVRLRELPADAASA